MSLFPQKSLSRRELEVRAWYINTWLSYNGGWIFYLIVTGTVLLQQFRLTEPLAFGFFWVNFIAMVITMGFPAAYGISNMRGVWAQVNANLIGLGLQIYIAVFHWETLCAFDEALRFFRTAAAAEILHFGDHRIFGWIIWSIITLLTAQRVLKAGCIFHEIRKNRPW